MAKKFTFKKYIKTGKYKSFEKDSTDIKLNKKVVGTINGATYDGYKVSFAIKREKTEQNPAPFKWIRLKADFKSEKEAREFINHYYEKIQTKYDLYSFDD